MKEWSKYFLFSLFCCLCLINQEAFAQKSNQVVNVIGKQNQAVQSNVLGDCCKKDKKCCATTAFRIVAIGESDQCAESDTNCLTRLFEKNLKLAYPKASKQMINKTIKSNPNLQKEFFKLIKKK